MAGMQITMIQPCAPVHKPMQTISGSKMIVRRELILSAPAALLAAILPHHAFAADDPAGIVTAIYTRAAKGKGGGTFVIQSKAARTRSRRCRRRGVVAPRHAHRLPQILEP
jgi:hypothetical protein